jgi:hypothetical protein
MLRFLYGLKVCLKQAGERFLKSLNGLLVITRNTKWPAKSGKVQMIRQYKGQYSSHFIYQFLNFLTQFLIFLSKFAYRFANMP